MSYPRNSASPPRISIGAVVQLSDGAVQTEGVSVVVRPEGGDESAGEGTLEFGASSGIAYYTPTQGETNYVAFVVVAYKAGCMPASQAVVTSASSTAGYVVYSNAAPPTVEEIREEMDDNSTRLEAIVGYVDCLPATWVIPATAGDEMALTDSERNSVADAVLKRGVANVEDDADTDSLCTVILASFHSSTNGTAWTIKQTDDATTHDTKTLATAATATYVTGVS